MNAFLLAVSEADIDLSIVIPCYNSASGLLELSSRLVTTLDSLKIKFEVFLVNDASPDDGATWGRIHSISKEDARFKGINLQFNVGQFLATIAGLSESRGKLTAIMDDDLQHAPEDLPKLLSRIDEELADAVLAELSAKKQTPFRNMGSRFVDATFALFHGKPRGLKMSSFAIFKRPVVNAIVAHQTRRPVLNSLVLSSTSNILNVKVQHHPRTYGKSGYSLRGLIRASLDIVFYATTAPLRVFSYLGALVSIASFSFSGYLIYNWFTNGSAVPGYTSIATLIGVLGGLILLGLGLIGEYIERIIAETSGKPRWVIAGKTSDGESD